MDSKPVTFKERARAEKQIRKSIREGVVSDEELACVLNEKGHRHHTREPWDSAKAKKFRQARAIPLHRRSPSTPRKSKAKENGIPQWFMNIMQDVDVPASVKLEATKAFTNQVAGRKVWKNQ